MRMTSVEVTFPDSFPRFLAELARRHVEVFVIEEEDLVQELRALS
jgi:hypothetical protein